MFWTEVTGMVDLRDFLMSHGITEVTDRRLTSAAGISADGRTIVGTGFGPNGEEAWVATIPEPSTIALAAFAVVGIVTFVRSKGGRRDCLREPVTTRTVLSATIRKLKTRSKIMDEGLAHARG
jgi:hypothetical protein